MTEYQPQSTPPASPKTPGGPPWQLVVAANAGILTWMATHDVALALSAASVAVSALPFSRDGQ